MRATGIVRRIDDLGRVVIPKEIRRTLRIREGDPLEIYTDTGGEVIFKKYSPMGELSTFAEQYAEVLNRVTKRPVLITDRDHVVAVSGISKKEFLERPLSEKLEALLENRKCFVKNSFSPQDLLPVAGSDKNAAITCPVIASGDITGAVILLQENDARLPDDSDIKLAQAAAAFLGKQNEE